MANTTDSETGIDLSRAEGVPRLIPDDVEVSEFADSTSESSGTNQYSPLGQTRQTFFSLSYPRSLNDAESELSSPENLDNSDSDHDGLFGDSQYVFFDQKENEKAKQVETKEIESESVKSFSKTELSDVPLRAQNSIRRISTRSLSYPYRTSIEKYENSTKLQQKVNLQQRALFLKSKHDKVTSSSLEKSFEGSEFPTRYYMPKEAIRKFLSSISPLIEESDSKKLSSSFDSDGSVYKDQNSLENRDHPKASTVLPAPPQTHGTLKSAQKRIKKLGKRKAKRRKNLHEASSFKVPEPYYRNRRDITQDELDEIKKNRGRKVARHPHRSSKPPVPIPFNDTPEAFRQASAPPRKFERVKPITDEDGWQIQRSRRRRDIKMDWITKWSRNVERASGPEPFEV